MIPKNLPILTALLFAALLTNCVCYRSFVKADFHEHHYTNSGSHREINAWWTEGEGLHSPINPAIMVDTRNVEGGEVQIGFIRPSGIDSKLVLNKISITDNHGNTVGSNAPRTPLSIPFRKKQFPLFVRRGDAIDVWRGYAEIKFNPNVSISKSPYQILIEGYYVRTNGTKEKVNSTITMGLKRSRRIANIADCWP